jgi:hypothetical protein
MIKISMDSSLAMSYLESLSTGELLGLAEKFGIDMPESLERNFIIEELMELKKEPHTVQNEYSDFLSFPVNYKKTFINVLIRDPLWAFAFWEINENDRENLENAAGFKGYFLRIVPLGDSFEASFLVDLGKNDNARYLGFPLEGGRSFKVELCAACKEKNSILALTEPFTMPRLIEPVSAAEKINAVTNNTQGENHNPLAQLSGADRFILTRSKDRMSWTHGPGTGG